ncbi:uncharacterized protein [Bemisia tabaci]|uniref:uncharacterized protein n=1 Tax=Bemisia tabaci TaxID=7038 RepID=UPI003B27BB3B
MAVGDSHHLENDSRFQLDERFHEEFSVKQKKKRKLQPESGNTKKRTSSFENQLIVRYDPTIPEHKKYELKSGQDRKPTATKKSERKKKKKEKLNRVEAAPQPVSAQTFVKISDDLKGYFQNKEKKNEGFSILKMIDEDKSSESDESEKDESVKAQTSEEQLSSVEKKMESKAEVLHIERMDLDKGTKKSYNETEPLLSASVDRREYFNPKKGKIFCPENGVWYDTLFPRKGDVRLEEGIRWLNTKPKLPENWSKFRRELYFDALQKQQKSFKKLNSMKNPHQQRRENQLNKARKYIHRSIKMKKGK